MHKELEIIYKMRNALIEIFPDNSKESTDAYITANELLTDLETLVRNKHDDIKNIEEMSKSKKMN